jgi:hypothetical protein
MTGPDSPQLRSLLEHASRYDLGAALKLLRRCGFDWRSIRFEGIRDLCAERGSIIRHVRIETHPTRVAILSLNAGLLSPGSPLPGYFKDFARQLPNPDSFIAFIGFLDAALLSNLAYATWPELSSGSGNSLGRTYRARLRFESPVTLHWLFRSAFPELGVSIGAAYFARQDCGSAARVGQLMDGRLVIGSKFVNRRAGFRVILHAEESCSEEGIDWEAEAEGRLGRIGPMLARSSKPIEIIMHFERYRHGQRLVGPGGRRRQLGVRPWLTTDRATDCPPGDVILRGAWEAPD